MCVCIRHIVLFIQLQPLRLRMGGPTSMWQHLSKKVTGTLRTWLFSSIAAYRNGMANLSEEATRISLDSHLYICTYSKDEESRNLINKTSPQGTPLYMMYTSKNFARMEVLMQYGAGKELCAKLHVLRNNVLDPVEDKMVTMHVAVLAEGSDEDFTKTIATFHDSMYDPEDLDKNRSEAHISKKCVNVEISKINSKLFSGFNSRSCSIKLMRTTRLHYMLQ